MSRRSGWSRWSPGSTRPARRPDCRSRNSSWPSTRSRAPPSCCSTSTTRRACGPAPRPSRRWMRRRHRAAAPRWTWASSRSTARFREEETIVAGVESRDFDSPDETRTPDKTRVDVVHMGRATAARMTFEPGWRWSECVKPVAGTESCQARHVGVVHAGRLAIKHEDGTEVEVGPGQAYAIEPGHDAWVVGDERFVGFEFESRAAEEYAKG